MIGSRLMERRADANGLHRLTRAFALWTRRCGLSAALLLGVHFLAPQPALAQGIAEVTASLSAMHQWVGTEANGLAWRRYLNSDQLESELSKQADADPAVIKDILSRYQSDANGLERRRFVAVKVALQAWLEELRFGIPKNLRQEAAQAKEGFQPYDESQIQQARDALTTAIADLENRLKRGSEENTEAWKKYLRWEQMQDQLTQETLDGAALQGVLERYRDDHAGLEFPELVAVREGLLHLLQAQYFVSRTDLQSEHAAQLDQLIASAESFNEAPSSDNGARLGQVLGWLSSAGQSKELVEGVRSRYTFPNLVARISRRVASKGFERDVQDTRPVRETILGTFFRGTAYTRGRSFLELVPSLDGAALDIRLTATTTTKNVGYGAQNVVVYSDGYTATDGRKRVIVDENGLRDFPADVHCKTISKIRGINAPIIINLFAPAQVARRKPATEAISARRAESRFERQMEEESTDRLNEANEGFQEDFKAPLIRRRSFPERLQFSTTSDAIKVHVLKADEFQLGATSPPPTQFHDNDIAIEIHQSIIGNLIEAAFGNDELSDEDAVELIEQVLGEIPEELQIGPDSDPWSITLAQLQPVSVSFRDGSVDLSIRIRSITRGEQNIRRPMEAKATYNCLTTPEGVRIVRDGEVEADYLRAGQQSVAQIAIKTFIRRKIAAMLPEEIDLNDLPLPTMLEDIGQLRSRQIASEEGWLAVGWDQVTEE